MDKAGEETVEEKQMTDGESATTPQSPNDNTDGLRSFFTKKKKTSDSETAEEKSTIWYNQNMDSADTSRLIPSGAHASAGDGIQTTSDFPFQYEYDFCHAQRGVAHIFVNQHFDPVTQQNYRTGAEQDFVHYADAFRRLGFQIKPYKDYTVRQILQVMVDFADGTHWDEDAVVFAFSTHGDQEVLKKQKDMPTHLSADIIYGRDGFLTVRNLTAFLTDQRCPSMANKPKLFFFQACRGEQLAETLEMAASNVCVVSEDKHLNMNTLPVEIPLHKDFFMAFSAPPGYYSFRRSKGNRCGSWFVLALCDAVKERNLKEGIDLMEVMTAVNHHMTIDPDLEFISNMKSNPVFNKRMIVPWVASMLTKSVCFRAKEKSS